MAPPVRVLHVLPHRGGGGETYVDALERIPGLLHERRHLSSGRALWAAAASVPAGWPGLARAASRADVVHAHGDVASVLALPLLVARPAIITTHGLHMLRRSEGRRRQAVAKSLGQAMAHANSVICTSAAERDLLSGLVRPGDRSKLTVIHNGIVPPLIPSAAERSSVRHELGVDDATVLGVFAGQLEARKAPLLAARAALRVRGAGIPFVLVLAGDGPQAPALEQLAGDAVKPLGYRSDLSRVLGAADVFVAPAEREGLSLALLEAMGHGLAVVGSDGPGNPEAIDDAGLLFPVGDEAALVDALTRLGADADLRVALGDSARRRALSEFGAERFVALTAAAYAQTLRGGPARPR